MIPSPWVALVLVLATFRAVRLLGWDTFPPIARARGWIVGEEVITNGSTNARMGLTNEQVEQTVRYRRPTLHELLSCAFCMSAWLGVGVYVAWRLEPSWTLTACFPLALSGAVGLIAKQWDP